MLINLKFSVKIQFKHDVTFSSFCHVLQEPIHPQASHNYASLVTALEFTGAAHGFKVYPLRGPQGQNSTFIYLFITAL